MPRQFLPVMMIVFLFPKSGMSVPPDKWIQMETNSNRFELGYHGAWTIFSSNPDVAQATHFPKTSEVLIETQEAGSALMLLINRNIGRLETWQITVGAKEQEAAKPDPAKLLGKCDCGRKERVPIACEVKDEECLQSLSNWIQGTNLVVADLSLVYTVPGLQALIKRLRSALDQAHFGDVDISFIGSNLLLKGKIESRDQAKMFLVLYTRMVGKLILEDRLELVDSSKSGQVGP
jgi:hypothetical protein